MTHEIHSTLKGSNNLTSHDISLHANAEQKYLLRRKVIAED